MAQEQILCLKSPTGLEQINDEVGESPKDRNIAGYDATIRSQQANP
ncbi:MAG TPA: hypothetical protein VN253_18980 [Kofleriaceae bacterium]|nr:hypothetical protein [Kofleriaceae bacterium]